MRSRARANWRKAPQAHPEASGRRLGRPDGAEVGGGACSGNLTGDSSRLNTEGVFLNAARVLRKRPPVSLEPRLRARGHPACGEVDRAPPGAVTARSQPVRQSRCRTSPMNAKPAVTLPNLPRRASFTRGFWWEAFSGRNPSETAQPDEFKCWSFSAIHLLTRRRKTDSRGDAEREQKANMCA